MLGVVIAGGGTGGHLFPGIAVAEELVRLAGARVRFVGSSHGIEREAVPRAGFRVELLDIRGVRREGLAGIARALRQVPASLLAARRLLRRDAPALVIALGGYASFPGAVAALAARIPLVLLEQNSRPGLVTRLLAPFAARICVSFPETARALGRCAVLTGNPVRGFVGAAVEAGPGSAVALPGEGRPFRVLVFGGSAGAHRLNAVVPGGLSRVGRALHVTHQTGATERDAIAQAYRSLGLDAHVITFIDDMAAEYRRADLVICRAGATTIAELTALGCAAILVPFPFAAGDHQRRNAETLVDAGAAWLVLDRDLDTERLAQLVRAAADDPARLAEMRRRARALGRPDAARRVAEECLALVGDDRHVPRRASGGDARPGAHG